MMSLATRVNSQGPCQAAAPVRRVRVGPSLAPRVQRRSAATRRRVAAPPIAASAPVSASAAAAAAAPVALDPLQQQQQLLLEEIPQENLPGPLPVVVRPVSGQLELRQVARLRAEAYYADDRSRFADSFKRQFASQEVDSLQHRTAPRGGRAQQCDCLVAVDPASQLVVGCIDVRVPQTATGLPAAGVPPGEPGGAYILNVVVDAPARGRGVGRALMRAAMARAVAVWGAARLFTHVEAGNDVASALYRGCGFRDHSEAAAYSGTSTLGRLLLLVAEADGVDTSAAVAADAPPAA